MSEERQQEVTSDIEAAIRKLVIEVANEMLPQLVSDEIRAARSMWVIEQQSKLLKPPEAAALLGVDVRTVWRWAAEDETFPIRRAGSELRFEADELLAWTKVCAERSKALQRQRKEEGKK